MNEHISLRCNIVPRVKSKRHKKLLFTKLSPSPLYFTDSIKPNAREKVIDVFASQSTLMLGWINLSLNNSQCLFGLTLLYSYLFYILLFQNIMTCEIDSYNTYSNCCSVLPIVVYLFKVIFTTLFQLFLC